MLEIINILGLKLSVIEDWISKIDPEIAVKRFKDNIWSIKQHIYVMNYWLGVDIEYIKSFDQGKPDKSFFTNIDAISDKIALQSENVELTDIFNQFRENAENLVLDLKNCKNNNSIELIEFIMDQLFFFSRHFGRLEGKLKMLSNYPDILYLSKPDGA
jgi:hypothetical protein